MVSIFNANINFKLSLKLRKYMDTEKIDNNLVFSYIITLEIFSLTHVMLDLNK
jgi:hypothetical protein